MIDFPLERNHAVRLTDSEFFPLECRVELARQTSQVNLFVTWLDPKAGGLKRLLASGRVSKNQFEGYFEEGGVKFLIVVSSLELGERRLLIGSIQRGEDVEEAADTFVAEEDPIDEGQ